MNFFIAPTITGASRVLSVYDLQLYSLEPSGEGVFPVVTPTVEYEPMTHYIVWGDAELVNGQYVRAYQVKPYEDAKAINLIKFSYDPKFKKTFSHLDALRSRPLGAIACAQSEGREVDPSDTYILQEIELVSEENRQLQSTLNSTTSVAEALNCAPWLPAKWQNF